jgi:hypothetical protein
MKTRQGFVSNSSSSSFIVGFKKVPKTDWELRDLLYPADKDGKRKNVTTDYSDDGGLDTTTAATIVFKDLQDQKPLTQKQIGEEINSGYFEGYPEINYSSDREADQIRRDYEKASGKDVYDKDADPAVFKKYNEATKQHWATERAKVDAAAKEYWKRVKAQFKGLKCYRFSYSDNDGTVFATLEHGNTFDSLPHIKISHH